MKNSGSNFDDGSDDPFINQFDIVRPFLDRLKSYSPDNGDLVDFCMDLCIQAINFRSEKESVPDMYSSILDYDERSSVLILSYFFISVVRDLGDYWDKDIISLLYDRMVSYCTSKDIDLKLLNFSILGGFGLSIQEQLDPNFPVILNSEDYN